MASSYGLSIARLAGAVQAAFNALGQIPQPVTYNSKPAVTPAGDYNIITGTVTPTQTQYPIKQAVFTKFSEAEIDHDVAPLTDEIMLFPRAQLPAVVISPNDTVIDAQGVVWEVRRQLRDPAGITGVLGRIHVRTSR